MFGTVYNTQEAAIYLRLKPWMVLILQKQGFPMVKRSGSAGASRQMTWIDSRKPSTPRDLRGRHHMSNLNDINSFATRLISSQHYRFTPMKTNTFGFSEATHSQQAANQPVPPGGNTHSFEQLLSANEAAALLNISTTTLLRAARRGEVPHMKLGRRIAFRLSELNRWLKIGTYNGKAICVA